MESIDLDPLNLDNEEDNTRQPKDDEGSEAFAHSAEAWQQIVGVFAHRRLEFCRVIAQNRRKSQERMRKQMALLRQQYLHRMIDIRNEFLLELPMPKDDPEPEERVVADFWEKSVPNFSATDWLETFRMSKSTFDWIVRHMDEEMKPMGHAAPLNKLIHLDKRIAMGIYGMASGDDYRTVAKLFGVSRSSCYKFMRLFASQLVKKTSDFLIAMPAPEQLPEIIQNFEEISGLPLMVGCLGCCHIPVAPAKKNVDKYMNANDWPSLLLEALVDDKLLFRSISMDTLKPSFMTDLTELDNAATNLLIENQKISSYVVGSPSYPLRPWIMKKYPIPETAEELVFNNAVDKVLSVKDQAFQRLFSRWRILTKVVIEPATMSTFVSACVAMHNLIEENGDEFKKSWVRNMHPAILKPVIEEVADEIDCEEGASVRRGLTECLIIG